jgi:hypothetical protein
MELCYIKPVTFPTPTGISVNMLPFLMGDNSSLPKELQGYLPLVEACGLEPEQIGKVGYLSVMETAVLRRESQRRPGIHTDKHPSAAWGGGWGGGGVEEGKRHDGIYLASTVSRSCRAWDVHVETPGRLGDCEHMRDDLEKSTPVYLEGNQLYWMTDSCPHESLPLSLGTFRQWFRLVTHKIGMWYEQHSTKNPLVPPAAPIFYGSKFDA